MISFKFIYKYNRIHENKLILLKEIFFLAPKGSYQRSLNNRELNDLEPPQNETKRNPFSQKKYNNSWSLRNYFSTLSRRKQRKRSTKAYYRKQGYTSGTFATTFAKVWFVGIILFAILITTDVNLKRNIRLVPIDPYTRQEYDPLLDQAQKEITNSIKKAK